jgi:hypothetical protein
MHTLQVSVNAIVKEGQELKVIGGKNMKSEEEVQIV